MSNDPSIPLQAAIFRALSGANIGAPVMHTIPSGTALPWVVIGDDQIVADYDAADFSDCHARVHTFASDPVEAKRIAGKIKFVLDGAIDIEGWDCPEAYFEDQTMVTESDGQTRHIVQSFFYMVIERSEGSSI